MMWDHAMERILDLIRNDPAMTAIIGDQIRMAGPNDQAIPGLEYTLLTDTEGELWAPMKVQFDLWTANAAIARQGERRLRQLLHHNLPQTLGDMRLWMQYRDAASLATPSRSNFVGRGLRFEFTPLREQYAGLDQ